MIAFSCPKCEAALKTADDKAGLRIKCPNCGSAVQVPSRSDAPVTGPREDRKSAERASKPTVKRAATKPASVAEEPEDVQESHGQGKRSFPLWLLAVIIPAGMLFCAGVAAILIYAVASHRSAQPSSVVQGGVTTERHSTEPQRPSPQGAEKGSPPNNPDGRVAANNPKGTENKVSNNSGQPIKADNIPYAASVGDIVVVCYRTIPWAGACRDDGRLGTINDVFLLEIGLGNLSKNNRSVVFEGWEDCAELRDEFGNNCRQLRGKGRGFGDGPWGFNWHRLRSIVGAGQRLDPDKANTIWLPFEKPIDKAKTLTLSSPADRIGGKGTIQLTFPVNHITPERKRQLEQLAAEERERLAKANEANRRRRMSPEQQAKEDMKQQVAATSKANEEATKDKPLKLAEVITQELQRGVKESSALATFRLRDRGQIPTQVRIPDPFAGLKALLNDLDKQRLAVAGSWAEGEVAFLGAEGIGRTGLTVTFRMQLPVKEQGQAPKNRRPRQQPTVVLKAVTKDDASKEFLRMCRAGQTVKVKGKLTGGIVSNAGLVFFSDCTFSAP